MKSYLVVILFAVVALLASCKGEFTASNNPQTQTDNDIEVKPKVKPEYKSFEKQILGKWFCQETGMLENWTFNKKVGINCLIYEVTNGDTILVEKVLVVDSMDTPSYEYMHVKSKRQRPNNYTMKKLNNKEFAFVNNTVASINTFNYKFLKEDVVLISRVQLGRKTETATSKEYYRIGK